MRKFLPIAIFGLIFSSVLILHAIFDRETSTFAESTAKLGVKRLEPSKHKKLEDTFAKSLWKKENGEMTSPVNSKAKIQIVNFWATWCQPCLEEMPSMMNLKKKFKDDEIEIFAINTDDEDQLKAIGKIKKKLKINNEFTMILDQKSQISDQFDITAIPVTVVFKNGKVLEYNNGPVDFEAQEFLEKIKSWLK